MHVSAEILAILIAVGFCAGFVDAIAGGGLIALPTLLAIGLPPVVALATNKFQMIAGESAAFLQYTKHNKIDFKKLAPGLLAVFVGSSAGAIIVQLIHPEFLQKIIPLLLLIVLIYFLLPKQRFMQSHPLMIEMHFFIISGLIIGFYNGFFGPGTGTLWTASLLFFLAYDLRSAIFYTKPLNIAGNLFSLIWFILNGKVYYLVAICMGIGTFTGGRTGARFVIYRDIKLIKTVFTIAVALMTIGLFYKYY